MRSQKLSAALARMVRGLRRTDQNDQDATVPMTAVGALAAGLLLSVGFLAATESRAPAVQNETWDSRNSRDHQGVMEPREESSDHPASSRQVDLAFPQNSELDAQNSPLHSDIRWFNNRPIRPAGTINMLVTAYSPDERSCGKWADGITASGYSVWTNGMKLVAADTSILPFGSLVSIPGYDAGDAVPVLDRGGAIRGNRLDVLFPTHEAALEWGVQRLEVTVWEYADGAANGFRQQHGR